EQPLDVHAAQGWRVDTVPEFLRPYVSHQVSGAVRVAVGVAIEAGYPAADMLAPAILRLVELLLRKRREQQAESFDLLGVEQTVKELIEVFDGDQLPLGDVTQVGTRGQKNGRWEFGKEVVRNVEVKIEACKVSLLLLVDLINFELREKHSTFRVVWVRQRKEAGGKDVAGFDLFGGQLGELVP